jgi:Chromosome segregation protein Csm1/Pcs1
MGVSEFFARRYVWVATDSVAALHFKLAVSHEGGQNASSYDTAEFHYMPLLDPNRDRDLVDILPDYLSEDITFSRQNAWKFYTRVIDTLAKRVHPAS